MRYGLLAVASALFLVTGFTLASGQKDDLQKRLTEALGLSVDQQRQIAELRELNEPTLDPLQAEVDRLRADLVAGLQSPQQGPLYRAELQEKFERLNAKKSELSSARFHMALDIRETLSPDQLTKFKGLRGTVPQTAAPGKGTDRK